MSCDDEALINGSNLAVLGSELLQFGTVEPLGQGRFRLTRLVRGRRGTEWATNSHNTEEMFALIEPDSLRTVPLASWVTGTAVSAFARNVSGVISESVPIDFNSECLRPPCPIALNFAFDGEGNLNVSWTRRSRNGWAWIDEMDAPISETREQYRVTVAGTSETIELETVQPALQISAAELGAVGPGTAAVAVRQVRDWAASRPASATLTI